MISLLKCIDDSEPIYRFIKKAAKLTDMPESTVFLSCLSVFGSMACRRYHVSYQDGAILPIGLYALMEHPPGTGKSRCVDLFAKPFFDIMKTEAMDSEERTVMFITNATPEATEQTLEKTGGFFSAVSSEQGLVNSLFGLSYTQAGRQHNNDLALNAFDGGYHSSHRVTRNNKYVGRVCGGISVFSQEGSIRKILEQSNGTGLADRFLFLSEPNFLGKRDFLTEKEKLNGDLDWYFNKCRFFADICINPLAIENTQKLLISPQSYLSLSKLRQSIEPKLADGCVYSDSFVRGSASKCVMQAMKIAALLHLLSDTNRGYSIDHKHIIAGIAIAEVLLDNLVNMAEKVGYSGKDAESASIFSYFEKRRTKRLLFREIYNSLRTTKPFCEMSGSKGERIRESLMNMVETRQLNYDGKYFEIN